MENPPPDDPGQCGNKAARARLTRPPRNSSVQVDLDTRFRSAKSRCRSAGVAFHHILERRHRPQRPLEADVTRRLAVLLRNRASNCSRDGLETACFCRADRMTAQASDPFTPPFEHVFHTLVAFHETVLGRFHRWLSLIILAVAMAFSAGWR